VVSGEPNFLMLPSNKMVDFINNESKIYDYQKLDTLSMDILAAQEMTKVHLVRKGESLGSISQKYGCSVSDLKSWNNLTSNTLHSGKKLTIYIHGKAPVQKTKVANSNTSTSTVSTVIKTTEKNSDNAKTYTVKKGDSLYKIAENHNTTVEELKRLNNLGINYNLMPGKVLKINEI
jgi:membrane-bound lytic murein transglycosylase D